MASTHSCTALVGHSPTADSAHLRCESSVRCLSVPTVYLVAEIDGNCPYGPQTGYPALAWVSGEVCKNASAASTSTPSEPHSTCPAAAWLQRPLLCALALCRRTVAVREALD